MISNRWVWIGKINIGEQSLSHRFVRWKGDILSQRYSCLVFISIIYSCCFAFPFDCLEVQCYDHFSVIPLCNVSVLHMYFRLPKGLMQKDNLEDLRIKWAFITGLPTWREHFSLLFDEVSVTEVYFAFWLSFLQNQSVGSCISLFLWGSYFEFSIFSCFDLLNYLERDKK